MKYLLKICSICKLPKTSSGFYSRNNREYPYCKTCHYEMNKIPKIKSKLSIRNFVKQLKLGIKCCDCKIEYPYYVMDFDHRPGELKKLCINQMIAARYSKEEILEEIKKCDLVCSNCHRIRTHERRANVQKKKQ